MAEHPIIFSTEEMVRAILDGRKTQTRRIIKNPKKLEGLMLKGEASQWCLYGKVGDTLWVREAWSLYGTGWCNQKPNQETIYVGYKADKSRRNIILPYDIEKQELCNGLKTPGQNNPYGDTTDREAYLDWQEKWWQKQKNKSARSMYRWAARIFLEITGLRVERVQDINLADIKAEGLSIERKFQETKDAWINLWDSLNAKRGYGWDKNPWVWVIEFKKVKALKGGK